MLLFLDYITPLLGLTAKCEGLKLFASMPHLTLVPRHNPTVLHPLSAMQRDILLDVSSQRKWPFSGSMISFKRCMRCLGDIRTSTESFSHISLPLPPVSPH
jgi:hypothetical protein